MDRIVFITNLTREENDGEVASGNLDGIENLPNSGTG